MNKKNLLFFFLLFFAEFVYSQNIKCSFSPKFTLDRSLFGLDSLKITYSTEIDFCNLISETTDTNNRTFFLVLKRQFCSNITHYQPFEVIIKEKDALKKSDENRKIAAAECERLLCDKKIFMQFFLNGKDITDEINLRPQFLFFTIAISFD